MPIVTEKMFIDMDRLAKRRNLSDEDKAAFYQSFMGTRVPEITAEELTEEEKTENLAYEVLEIMENNEFDYDDLPHFFEKSKRALVLDPNCIAAYEACLRTCPHRDGRDRYILRGIEAGEIKFGGKYEEEFAGNFWGLTETRPYMRLLVIQAETLFTKNRRREAMTLYERLLYLHTDDSVGGRYPLSTLYLEFGEFDKFINLIDKFEEDHSAHWHYNQALYQYMIDGDSDLSDEAMDDALDFNPYILPYLRGKKKPDHSKLSSYYSPQEESGALIYCFDSLYLWHLQFGIQKWLKKFA